MMKLGGFMIGLVVLLTSCSQAPFDPSIGNFLAVGNWKGTISTEVVNSRGEYHAYSDSMQAEFFDNGLVVEGPVNFPMNAESFRGIFQIEGNEMKVTYLSGDYEAYSVVWGNYRFSLIGNRMFLQTRPEEGFVKLQTVVLFRTDEY